MFVLKEIATRESSKRETEERGTISLVWFDKKHRRETKETAGPTAFCFLRKSEEKLDEDKLVFFYSIYAPGLVVYPLSFLFIRGSLYTY
jgi:hypothetical protein